MDIMPFCGLNHMQWQLHTHNLFSNAYACFLYHYCFIN